MCKKLLPVLLLFVFVHLSRAQFSGAFAVTNWTQTSGNSNGYVDVSGAPGSILMVSSNTSGGGYGYNDFQVTITQVGYVSFNWSYNTNDVYMYYDQPFYLLNGAQYPLDGINLNVRGQSGSQGCIAVSPGDVFGFRINSVDNVAGSGYVTISNFALLTNSPTPLSVVSTATAPLCAGQPATLTASGGNNIYSWSGGVTNGVGFIPSTSKTYTVLSGAGGCNLAATVDITVHPVPAIALNTSTVCSGVNNTLSLANGYALRFSGSEYAGIPISNLSEFTLEYWMRTTDYNPNTPADNAPWYWGTGIVDAEEGGIQNDYGTSLVGGNIAFGVGNNDLTIYSTSAVNTGNWVHVAASWSQYTGEMNLYINGVLEATSPYASMYQRQTSYLTVGAMHTGASYFTGDVEDVQVWGIVRSANDIQSDMSSCLTGSESGLLALYHMDEGPGSSTLTDQTANHLDAGINSSDYNSIWISGKTICNVNNIISYIWNPGSYTTATLPVNLTTSAQYSISVVNNYSCASSAAVTVSVIALPAVAVSSGTLCSGSVFTMVPSGADTYTFSSGSDTVSPLTNSSYTVYGTAVTGCSNTAVSSVSLVALPAVSVNSGLLCIGSTFTLNGSGASTYNYPGGSNLVSPSVDASYTVIGTAASGCTNAAVSSVTVVALPVISVNSGSICSGKIFTMTPNGAATYTFSSGSSTVSPPAGTSSFSVTGTSSLGCVSGAAAVSGVTVSPTPTISVANGTVCTGKVFSMSPSGANTYTFSNGSSTVIPVSNSSYSISGTSAQGCVSFSPAVASVTVNALPVLSISGNTSVCFGSAVTQTVSGASTYSWSSGQLTNTVSLSPSANSTYTVTGTDAVTSCSNTATKSITVNPLPIIGVNSGVICSGNSFTLVPNGASTYTYSGGSSVVTPNTSTSYSVNGTDALGCVSASPAVTTITVNITPTISVASGTVCAGKVFSMNPSGANTYTFSNGSSTVIPVSNSSYSISGTSAQGCVSFSPAVASVTVNALPVLSISGNTSVCFGSTVTQTVSGANTYSWSSGQITNTVSLSPSTNSIYTVTGTDAATTCSNTAIRSITVNPLPVIGVNSGVICSGNSFILVPNGASTYTYSGGSSVVSPNTSTSYSVNGTDALGCVSASPAVTTITVNITPTISVANGTVCAGKVFSMNPSGANTYTFSNGSSTIIPVSNSSYSISGTSTQGCVSFSPAVASVTVNALPVLSINGNTSVCFGLAVTQTVSGASTYSWSSGQLTNTVSLGPSANSTYTVTGTDAATTCSNTAIRSITVNPLPIVGVNSGVICSGNSFTLVPNGASTYTYSGGSSVVSPNTSTSYSVNGTDALGCVSASPAVTTITVNITPTISVANGTVCAGKVFSMNPSGANTYTFSNGASTVIPASNSSYSISGTSAQGCVSFSPAVASVTVNALPVLSISGNTSVCFGLAVTQTVSGANTYSWSSGQLTNTVSLSPSANSTYTVTGTDAATTCSNTATRSITVNPLPIIGVNSGVICSGNSFTLVPNGASTYTYSGGASVVSPNTNTSYSVNGTDALGCVSASPAVTTITVNITPTISVANGTVCAGKVFSMSPSGANTYTFSNGSSTVIPVSNSSYSISGTSAQGCVSFSPAVASVTVNALPVLSISGNTSVCFGLAVTQTVSGASTYSWSSGQLTNTVSLSPSANSIYTVTGTDAATTCSNTAIRSITVNPLPIVGVNSGVICSGNSFTLGPSGASTYTFSNGSSTVIPVSNSSYSISGTSAQGCMSFSPAVASVTVNALPVLSISGNTSVCFGLAVTQTVNGASTYAWSSGQLTNTVSLSPSANSTYTVTGTDAVTTCSNTATKSITVNPLPVISVNSGSICSGIIFTLNPGGASTYTFSGGSNTVSPLADTSYSVTGTDALGCVSASPAVASLTVKTTPTVTVNSGAICFGDSFTLSPGGGISTYTITGGTVIVSPTLTTTYSVTGTSTANCISSNTAVAVVTVNPLPVLSISGSSVVCHGSALTQTVSGTDSYTWNTGALTSTVSLNPLVNTTYSVTGTNTLTGCFSTLSKTISVNPQPTLSVNSGTLCSGLVFTMAPSGAVSYTFSSGSPTVSPFATTSYSVTGTNSLGCVSAGPAVSTVTVFTSPVISVNSGSICPGSSFTMIPSGVQTYTFYNGFSVVHPVSTTAYSVIGTSSIGCLSSNVAVSNVTVVPGPVLSISGNSAICNGSPLTLTVSGSNSYTWSTGATTTTISVNPSTATTYSVASVNLTTGCSGSTSKLITIGVLPVISVNSGNVCAGKAFTLTPSGASTYTISNGTGTVAAIVSPSANTSYFVSGTSAEGCVSAGPAIANVIVNQPPVISVNSGSICSGQSFTMVPGGASTYTFVNGGPVVSPSSSNSYSVFGIDLLGCVSNSPAISNVVVNSIPAISVNNGTVCAGNSFTIVPSGAVSYTFSGGSAVVTPLANTNYSVSGTSTAGCISATPAVMTVSVIALPLISVNNGTICPGSVFTMTPSGAASYTFSNGSPTVIPTGFTTYSVTGTSTGGCISATPAVAAVSIAPIPVISISNGTVCSGHVFTLSPSGADSYTYSSGSQTVSPQTSTTYSITGASIYGCVASNTAIADITALVTPTIFVAGNTAICAGQSITLNAMGAASYTWNGSAAGAGITTTLAASSTLVVEGEDGNGCVGTTAVQVTVNPLPLITAADGTICPGGSFSIVPSGALSYTYSSGSAVVSPSSTTVYSVSGTDANGCRSAVEGTVAVNVENAILISVSGPTSVCSGNTASLTASGGSVYVWSTGEQTPSIAPTITAGCTYTVVGSNGACADTAMISVAADALPDLQVSSSSPVICSGETVAIVASGAASYTWSSGEHNDSLLVTPAVNTSYSVVATGTMNSCVASAVITQSVSSCTGIVSGGGETVINLYPNPNTGSFNVEIVQPATLVISDSPGQVIFTQDMKPGKNFISLDAYAKGIYFATFRSGKNSRSYKVIVE